MAGKVRMPYSAVMGNPYTGPGGGGTPVTRTTAPQPKGTKNSTKSPTTNRTPTGRSSGGNW